jgi:hypothetical protein
MLSGVLSELQGIVDEASRLLGAPTTLEDTGFTLVAHSAQGVTLDAVRRGTVAQRVSTPQVRAWFEGFGITTSAGPVRTPADAALGVLPRLCVPARTGDRTHGYLWALDAGGPHPAAGRLDEVAALAARAAVLLARQGRRRESTTTALVDLLSPDTEDVARGVRALSEHDLLDRAPAVAVALVGHTGAADLAHTLWRLPRGVVGDTGPDGTVLLVALRSASDPGPAHRVAADVLARHAERLGAAERAGLVAAVGGPRTDVHAARASWREARWALRAAHPGVVADWAALGVARLLAAEPGADLLLDLGALDDELTRTARAYLDRAGAIAATAAELGIHRQTLYHRLGRVEALTGRSLRDGQDRLALHLALTLRPLLDPAAAHPRSWDRASAA